jgi:hypothetical protein
MAAKIACKHGCGCRAPSQTSAVQHEQNLSVHSHAVAIAHFRCKLELFGRTTSKQRTTETAGGKKNFNNSTSRIFYRQMPVGNKQ